MLGLFVALSSGAEACFGCHYDTLITLVAVAQDGSMLMVVSMGSADAVTLFGPGGVRSQHDLNAPDPTAPHTEDRAAEPRLNYTVRVGAEPSLPEPWASAFTLLERDEQGHPQTEMSEGVCTLKIEETTP